MTEQKGCFLIRDKTSGKYLLEYPTPGGHTNKCVFKTESTANGIIKNYILTHWLLKNFEWEVVMIGEDWKSPNYGVPKEK